MKNTMMIFMKFVHGNIMKSKAAGHFCVICRNYSTIQNYKSGIS